MENDGSVVVGALREYLFFRYFKPHPNVLATKKSWKVKNSIYTLMPLYTTTLTTLVKSLCFNDFLFVLRSVCNGVKAMHDQQWLHRDIKLENILVDVRGIVVADFNLVRWAYGEDTETSPKWFRQNATTHICTLWTRAPEVVLAEIQGKHRCEYGREFDMFSLGATFLSMLVGDYVFDNVSKGHGSTDLIRYITAYFDIIGTTKEIDKLYGAFTEGMPEFHLQETRMNDIIRAHNPKYTPEETSLALKLIFGLLHPDPKSRWTWTQVEEWFSTVSVPSAWSQKSVQALSTLKCTIKTKKYNRYNIDIGHTEKVTYKKSLVLTKESFWNLCGVSNIPPFITCEILRLKSQEAYSVQESQCLLFLLDCIHNYSGETLSGQISYVSPEDIWAIASNAPLFDASTIALGVSLRKSPFKLCCLATELAVTGKCENPEKLEDSKLIYLSTSAPFFANYGSLWKSQAPLRQTWFRLLSLNLA